MNDKRRSVKFVAKLVVAAGDDKMTNNSKTFESKANAKKFADKLRKNGQLNVQIWELPAFNNKSVYVVLWTEN